MLKEGAREVYVCAAHLFLAGPALERLDESPVKEVIVANTIPLRENAPAKITQLSIAPLLAEAIKRIYNNESVSEIIETFNGLKSERIY